MFMNCFPDQNSAAWVALFCLLWFVLGILLGRRLPRAAHRPARKRKRQAAPGAAARGDGVEIYVGNLSYDADEKDLSRMFQAFGNVAGARIIKNRFNGKSKGFGFVDMPVRREAAAAIRALSGKDMKGRKLVVNEARSRARD